MATINQITVNSTTYDLAVNAANVSGTVANATTATKLGTATKGSATIPIYLNAGAPTACTYSLAKSVPADAVFTDTNTKVTSVSNHYTPTANESYVLSADASSTTAATWDSTSLVTGVNLQRDAKGHVTGVSVDSIKMPSKPSTSYTLPTASSSTLGGVKVGTGLGISSGTLSVSYGTTATTACKGNDSRLSDSRKPKAHATTATTYGAGTASNYGHVKLSDSYTTSGGTAAYGVAASSYALVTAYNTLNSNLDTLIYTEWVRVDAPTIPPEAPYFFTYEYTKTGYTPIGIIGYQIQSTNDCVFASRIYYSSTSNCIAIGLRNTSGSTQTPDYVTVCVLSVKN